LILPIVLVVLILNNANKRRKKNAQKKINAYIAEVTREAGVSNYIRKQLLYQTLIIDEKARKLLIVEHNGVFAFDVYPLDAIKSNQVEDEKLSFAPVKKGQKQEHITTRVGIKLSFKAAEGKFLTLYDHHQHNIYLMADLEKEAHQLRNLIEKARNGV
jgi:hypothetical protein